MFFLSLFSLEWGGREGKVKEALERNWRWMFSKCCCRNHRLASFKYQLTYILYFYWLPWEKFCPMAATRLLLTFALPFCYLTVFFFFFFVGFGFGFNIRLRDANAKRMSRDNFANILAKQRPNKEKGNCRFEIIERMAQSNSSFTQSLSLIAFSEYFVACVKWVSIHLIRSIRSIHRKYDTRK